MENIWESWRKFRKGKRSAELDEFQYYLERNLYQLYLDLNSGQYRHGGYRKFIVSDNKKREVSVASIRDRVVHRLLYEYLISIYDKTFIPDIWSCRKGKGLTGAIERTQKLLSRYDRSFVWRSDIKKFFDHVDHAVLADFLKNKIGDLKVLWLLNEIINSYEHNFATASRERERESKISRRGIPIGNLTSQIFSNIYLDIFDKFVLQDLKPQTYLRYGDDFIIIHDNKERLIEIRTIAATFLKEKLNLDLHSKNDIIVKAKWGLYFLGTQIFPKGIRLNGRNRKRVFARLNLKNAPSYSGIVKKYGNHKMIRQFNWHILNKINDQNF